MRLKEWGVFIALGAIWGSSFLFIKLAGHDLAPFTLVAVRLGFGAAGLWSVTLLARKRLPRDAATLGSLLLLGIVNTTLPFVLITWGEKTIDSGVASVLNATVPLFALIIAHFTLEDERITWVRVMGLLTGFGGIALIFSRNLWQAAGENAQGLAGQAAVVAAAICYAGSTVFIRKKLRDMDPLVLATLQTSSAFLGAVIGALIVERPLSLRMSELSLFGVAWLGLLGTCLAYVLYFGLLQSWGATRSTLVTYFIPVVAVALGALFLGEPVDWRLFAGFGLIVSGIALVNLRAAAVEVAEPAEVGK